MHSMITFLAMSLGLTAFGQQPAASRAVENDLDFRGAVQKTFLQYEDSLSTHCQEIAPDWSRAKKVFYVKPTYDAQGKLTSTVWSELVPGLACGQPRNFRALVTIRDGRMNVGRQLPGTSNTTLLLEHDARTAVMGALKVHHPQETLPTTFDVLDTDLLGSAVPPAHQAWKETWLISIGGRLMRVPIEFVPDQTGSGTSFVIDPRTIVDVFSKD